MPTDDERRAVARRLRRSRSEWSGMGWRLWLGPKFCAVVLSDGNRDELEDAAHRLADLIEPTDGFDLDTVQRVCFECMEGCDEPEWTLYTTIHDAIARYKRGESGPSIDRDALLALADDIDKQTDGSMFDIWLEDGHYIARRIREACGEVER